ncbi:helix-turn-helix domain-containing protein [Microbacterium sp. NPDC091313]
MEPQRISEHLARELQRSIVLADAGGAIVGVAQPTAGVPDEVLVGDAGSGWTGYPLVADGDRRGAAYVGWRERDELRADELGLIDEAARLLPAVSEPGSPRARRRALLRDLLDVDPAVRRESLREASDRGWLSRTGTAELRALVFADGIGVLHGLRAAHDLARALPGRGEVLRERGDGVFVLTSSAASGAGLDGWIRQWAARESVPLVAVGSASVRAGDEDLARAAYAAATAAELSRAMPELADVTSRDGLGGWALLSAVRPHPALLSVASPAAEALCAIGEVPRETVEVYLDAAGRARDACERLHIHRTTLYYRLDHLPEVVKDALADGMQRSTLHLALKLDRLWSAAATPPAATAAGHAPASRDAGDREGKDR